MTDFGEIYKDYFTEVYRYVLSIAQNEAIAEEITQETFFKALRYIDQFNGTCKLYVWLCQIAKNTYLTFLKKQKHMTPHTSRDFQVEPSNIESDYLDKEMTQRFHISLHNLKEPYKEVFTLRVFGELPFLQISELFGKTDSWARLIFFRAKKQLQEELK